MFILSEYEIEERSVNETVHINCGKQHTFLFAFLSDKSHFKMRPFSKTSFELLFTGSFLHHFFDFLGPILHYAFDCSAFILRSENERESMSETVANESIAQLLLARLEHLFDSSALFILEILQLRDIAKVRDQFAVNHLK